MPRLSVSHRGDADDFLDLARPARSLKSAPRPNREAIDDDTWVPGSLFQGMLRLAREAEDRSSHFVCYNKDGSQYLKHQDADALRAWESVVPPTATGAQPTEDLALAEDRAQYEAAENVPMPPMDTESPLEEDTDALEERGEGFRMCESPEMPWRGSCASEAAEERLALSRPVFFGQPAA